MILTQLRFAARGLRRSRGFAATVIVCLALGIGVNTAIFSVVRGVLLRPLPYPNPDRLVVVTQDFRGPGQDHMSLSPAEYIDYRAGATDAFEDIGVAVGVNRDLVLPGGEPERLSGTAISPSFLTTLGMRPLAGRLLTADDAQPSSPRVTVISERVWDHHFTRDPNVIGRSVNLSGNPTTVVGVLPSSYTIAPTNDLWVPLRWSANDLSDNERSSHYLQTIARLRARVEMPAALARMNAVAARMVADHSGSYGTKGVGVRLATLTNVTVGPVRTMLFVLLGAVGLVLLIACANVANILLARAAARRREMAVRIALGAARGRMITELLAESFVLAGVASVIGLLLAMWGVRALVLLTPGNLPRVGEVRIDGAVLSFTLALTFLTTVLFGLVPALQSSRQDVNQALRDGGRSGTAGRGHTSIRSALLVLQVALALVLSSGAGLLIRSFSNLQHIDPGFRTDGVATMRVDLPATRYPDDDSYRRFSRAVVERVSQLPGVRSAGATIMLPIGDCCWDVGFSVIGQPPRRGTSMGTQYRPSTPGYFSTMGIRSVRGRMFDGRDQDAAPLVAMVNETFVRRYFPDLEPLGQRIKLPLLGLEDTVHIRQIVGVVSDVRQFGLTDAPEPEMYVPFDQQPRSEMTVVARADDPKAIVNAMRAAVRAIDPAQAVYNARTIGDVLSESLARRRFNLTMLSAFATLALVLAALGVYGVVSYLVALRTHEIGIRMALGAHTPRVLRLVLGGGIRLAAIGVVFGVTGSVAMAKALKGMVYDVSVTDPLTLGAVSALILAVTLLASWIPARRAARIEPVEALKSE